MRYRDDTEGVRARLEEAERELAEARETIRRLRGEVVRSSPGDDVDRLTGVPRFLRLQRALPFAVSDDALLAITDMVEARVPGGSVSQVGPRWTHRRRGYVMNLHRAPDQTSLELTLDHRPARLLFLLGAPGLALIAGVLGAALLAGASGGNKLAIALGATLGALGAIVGLRALVRRAAASEREVLGGAFEAAVHLVTHHASTPEAAASVDEREEDESRQEEDESLHESAGPRLASR